MDDIAYSELTRFGYALLLLRFKFLFSKNLDRKN